MGQIEFFDHTADLGVRVFAADLNDLFRTLAEALFDVIVAERQSVRPTDVERVTVASDSPESLLIIWLNELIFRSETNHKFYSRFDVRVAHDGTSLEAEIFGEPVDLLRHVVDHEVKSATHHGVELSRNDDGWMAAVILDI